METYRMDQKRSTYSVKLTGNVTAEPQGSVVAPASLAGIHEPLIVTLKLNTYRHTLRDKGDCH